MKLKYLLIAIFALLVVGFIDPSKALAQQSRSKGQRPPNQQSGLTVQQILQLLQARISEDVIIAKVKQNGRPFNLSTEQILQLKQVGASDNLIKSMMDPKAEPTSPVVLPKPAPQPTHRDEQPSNLPNTPPTHRILALADEVGFYLLGTGKPIQIMSTGFSKPKASYWGVIGSSATIGLIKAKAKGVVRGASATVRTTNKRPEFLFYVPEGDSPSDYLLIKLEKKKDTRECIIGSVGLISGENIGFEEKNIVKFSSEKITTRKYLITIKDVLEPGEYAFYPVTGIKASSDAAVLDGKLYDFGIDY